MLPKCHSNYSLAKFSLELGFWSSAFTPKWRWSNHSKPHYSSCTFKATTPLRSALFHSPPLSFRNHLHQNQRKAHRNAITLTLPPDPASWPECKSLATPKVSPTGSTSHHVSLCPSHLNSSQEPEENRVAPLRPIALRRSSQWRNHQKLRENISTEGTVRSESLYTRKYSESVLKCSKKRTSKVC